MHIISRPSMKLLLTFIYCWCFVPADSSSDLQWRPAREEGEWRQEHACTSLDIRNECKSFLKLENCTVITGYLIIVLLPLQNSSEFCRLEHYRFPLLREITDFLIFHEVRNVSSVRNLFPNLTVIRGQQLFLNYAFGITYMADLQTLEFDSLIAIQRGHVIIGNNPKLCHLDRINWDRLTLTAGENHVYPTDNEKCPANAPQHFLCSEKCESGYCWSPEVCQYFENNRLEGEGIISGPCPEQCLGGCHSNSSRGCLVCRSWTDHGNCVEQCPKGLYAFEHFLRCYTRDECLERGAVIHQDRCLQTCPTGYKLNKKLNECKICASGESCRKICTPLDPTQPFWIYSLGDVDALKGCQILNGSVFITLRNRIDEGDLMRGFQDVQDIQGYLKIYKSHQLSSLKFLRNVHRIHGRSLENEHYAFVLYNNRRIRELWTGERQLELIKGGMYIHLNNRLCNRYLKTFVANVAHDRSLDSLQGNEEELLCDPSKLNLQVKVLSHDSIALFWPLVQTSDNVAINYRIYSPPIKNVDGKSPQPDLWDTDLDSNICTRNVWYRITRTHEQLEHNLTHYRYIIDELKAYTWYTVLMKTFSDDDTNHENIRSEALQVRTEMDYTRMPSLTILNKTESSLTIYIKQSDESVTDYWIVELFDMFHWEKRAVTARNYCKEPLEWYPLEATFEDCCYQQLPDQEAEHFDDLMRLKYSCDRNHLEFCVGNETNKSEEDPATPPPILTKRLESAENVYTVKYLERYHLYRFEVRGCNRLGCGSRAIATARTNYSLVADKLHDLSVCRKLLPEGRAPCEYHLYFTDPLHPNGVIVSYTIHFRNSTTKTTANFSRCVTFEEHSRLHYPQALRILLNQSFEEISIEVSSLAGNTFTDWIPTSRQCETRANIFDMGTQKPSARASKGMNTFLAFFLLGAGGTALWILYKGRYWRQLFVLRRYVPVLICRREQMLPLGSETTEINDDRQILVDSFNSVHFQNTPGHEMLSFQKP